MTTTTTDTMTTDTTTAPAADAAADAPAADAPAADAPAADAPAAGVRVDPEFRSLIPPLTDAERSGLEASLLAEGCRDPLVVWEGHGLLLDGHNRHDLCGQHGLAFAVVRRRFPDRDVAKAWVIRNQFARRNLTPFQRAELALALGPLVAAGARRNVRATQNNDAASAYQKSDKQHTLPELAKVAGLSHDTIHKAKVVAGGAPEHVKEKLRRAETTINREYKAIVQAQRHADQVRAVEAAPPPEGKYHVIAADPPWSYGKRAGDPSQRGACPYPCMPLEAIRSMPVAGLAREDCVLWLWATNAFLEPAFGVARAWGFEPKTVLTWAKDRVGVGDWLRGQTEHCLLAVRGRPAVSLTNQTTLLRGAVREHSRKPDEFYALVESLCHGSRCELFGRERRAGWATFGAEAGKFGGGDGATGAVGGAAACPAPVEGPATTRS